MGYIMTRTKLCIVGACGRLGKSIIQESVDNFEIVGAVEHSSSNFLDKSLKDLGIIDSDIKITSSSNLSSAISNADVAISATIPDSELANAPVYVQNNKKVIIGTTGFSDKQYSQLVSILDQKIPSIIASNFSIGMNFLFYISELVGKLSDEFEISINEKHHSQKIDSPSGTALSIAKIISESKGYEDLVFDRSKHGKRKKSELEVTSERLGGTPGIHEVSIAGQYEILRFEHIAFSRLAFARGALSAASWINNISDPQIYSMQDVISR